MQINRCEHSNRYRKPGQAVQNMNIIFGLDETLGLI
jgi:hypothetical protein